MLFLKKKRQQFSSCCRGCSNVLQVMSQLVQAFIFQKLSFSWNLLQASDQGLSEKNPYHAICRISQDVPVYYYLSAYNKGKF